MSKLARTRGLTVIELLIALLLGMLIIGGALTVFLSNRETFRVSEALGRVQETARVAFELMARDVRGAAANPCEFNPTINLLTNVLNNQGSAWWSPATGSTTGVFLQGFAADTAFPDSAFGTGAGQRLDGTEAIQLISGTEPVIMVRSHNPTTATFTAPSNAHGFSTGDIAMACDFFNTSIFQVTSASSGSAQIAHAASGTPGNSRTRLVGPTQDYKFGCFQGLFESGTGVCREPDPADPTPREWPATLARLKAVRWFVANNAAGRPALHRSELINTSGTISVNTVEVTDNIANLDIQYLVGTGYVDAAAVTDWSQVTAVRLEMQVLSAEAIGGQALDRNFVHVVTIRSRA